MADRTQRCPFGAEISEVRFTDSDQGVYMAPMPLPSGTQGLNEAGPVAPDALRSVCGNFVTGVAVITSGRGEEAVGTTVNSFTSVSLEPPLVLFCLHAKSRLRPVVQKHRAYVVNILSSQQEMLAWTFACKDTAGLDGVPHRSSVTGVPVLDGTLASLSCRLVNSFESGDHTVFVGEVVEADQSSSRGNALVFFRGKMGSVT
ncbi:flavin reductase family protein [Streptomyces mirabilis]|uniref:flavin reductase family protein n=1 Tax=Streptomyces mirabilis TaxID=68239 RepID=UPI00339DFDBA